MFIFNFGLVKLNLSKKVSYVNLCVDDPSEKNILKLEKDK